MISFGLAICILKSNTNFFFVCIKVKLGHVSLYGACASTS